MYVYVLREEVPYEEHDWIEIVKDDEFAIYKIKKILIENVYTDIAKNKAILKSLEECISKIGSVKNADEFGFYNKQYNTLRVEKFKVI